MPREIKDINFNAGYNSCDARMQILKNSVVQRDLEGFDEIGVPDIGSQSYIYVNQDGEPSKIKLASITDPNQGVQADWNEEDTSSLAYIKNKPGLLLNDDIVAAYTVGGIRAGETIPAGTPIYDILTQILTASRIIDLKFGVVSDIKNINPDYIPTYISNIPSLLVEGKKFSNVEIKDQYYVLLVPKTGNIQVTKVFQGGYRLTFEYKTVYDSRGNSYFAYYQTVPSTGVYTFMYMFEEVEE